MEGGAGGVRENRAQKSQKNERGLRKHGGQSEKLPRDVTVRWSGVREERAVLKR